MAPHASLSESPGWAAGFTSSHLLDSPARPTFLGVQRKQERLRLLIAPDLQIVWTDLHLTLQVLAQSLLLRQLTVPMSLHPSFLLEELPTQVYPLCRTSTAGRRPTSLGVSPLSLSLTSSLLAFAKASSRESPCQESF